MKMKIAAATWRTALLAGLWTGLGLLIFVAFEMLGWIGAEHRIYYFAIGGIPFFWGPAFFFVFGGPSAGFLSDAVYGRVFCWMLGVIVVVAPGLRLMGRLFPSH